jgi:DHA1 family multidrug resistance protein-like MFS transporter
MEPYRKTLYILSSYVFLVMLGMTMISPILPLYAVAMGASVFMVSLLVAAFAMARIFLDLPAGLLSSKYHPKSLMILGLFLVSASSVVCGFAPNYWVLLLGRVIEGIGSAFFTTMSTMMLAVVVPEKNRGKDMSIYTALLLLGGIMGPGFGGIVASIWGLNAPFFFYAFLVGIGIVVVAVMIEKTAIPYKASEIKFKDVKLILTDPSMMLVNLATLSLFFTRAGITSTLVPLFAYKNLHISEFLLGVTLTCTSLFMFFTMTPSGTYTDKHGRKPSMIACLILTGIIVMFLPFAWNYLSFLTVMVIYGLMLGLSGPISAWMIDLTPRDRIGVAMGVFRTVNDAGFVAGPLILGSIASVTMKGDTISPIPFLVASVYVFVVGALIIKARDPVTEGKKPQMLGPPEQ